MARLRALPLVGLLSLCVPSAQYAQQETQPVATGGTRVRITSPRLERRIAGPLQQLETGYVVVSPTSPKDMRGQLVRLSWEDITKFEISAGQKRNTLKGLGLGSAIGFGAGFLAGLFADPGAFGDDEDATALETTAPFYGLTLGVLGGLVGMAVGSNRTDTWEQVELSEIRPLVALSPRNGGRMALRLGLQLRL